MNSPGKITVRLVENLLKNWRSGQFEEESLSALAPLLLTAPTADGKRLLLREVVYTTVSEKLPATFSDFDKKTKKEREATLKGFLQEKRQNEETLIYLYCRYMSVKQYQVQELARLANISPRTLRRYLLNSFAELQRALQEKLLEKKTEQRKHHIKSYFPTHAPDQIFGITPILADVEKQLAAPANVHALSIEGIGGVGKTVLAQHILKTAYEKQLFDDYAWVSAKQQEITLAGEIMEVEVSASTLDDIVSRLAQQLGQTHLAGYPTDEKLTQLQHLSHEKKLLVVIDNLETVADVRGVVPALLKLSAHSTIIFTSRKSLSLYPAVHVIKVPELSFEHSLKLIKNELRRRGMDLSVEEETIRRIYEITGGIPLALKLAAAQLGRVAVSEIVRQLRMGKEQAKNVYLYIYHQAWQLLSDAGKELLLSMLLVSPSGEDRAWICEISGISEKKFNRGIAALQDLSLIELSDSIERPRYRIHRLTTSFLQTNILQGWEEQDA